MITFSLSETSNLGHWAKTSSREESSEDCISPAMITQFVSLKDRNRDWLAVLSRRPAFWQEGSRRMGNLTRDLRGGRKRERRKRMVSAISVVIRGCHGGREHQILWHLGPVTGAKAKQRKGSSELNSSELKIWNIFEPLWNRVFYARTAAVGMQNSFH